MAQEWYVKVGEQARGPLAPAKLKQYATEGRLKPDMLVRCGGEGAWVPAARIKGLFPASPQVAEETAPSQAPPQPEPAPPVATDSSSPSPNQVPTPVVPEESLPFSAPETMAEEEEINPFAIVPPYSEPVIEEVPEIVVEPKPLVAAKAKKPSRKTKSKRGKESQQEDEEAPSKKGKRRKGSGPSLQVVLGIAAAVAIVGLSGALVYVLWFHNPQGTVPPVAEVPAATAGSDPSTATEPVSAVNLSLEELFDKTAAAVAFIEGRTSSGTGWVVAPDLLATNRHVIEGELMRHIKVHFPSAPESRQGPYQAKVVYIDNVVDLAFLEVDTSTPPLTRASNVEFRPGRDIAVIGCPGVSPDLTIKNGIVKGTLSSKVQIEGNDYDQLSISINPGNSGGPVFNLKGQVIGVVTLKATEQEGIGFSIPIAEIDRLLERAQQQSRDEVAKTRALHRARVVIAYVEITGKLYKQGMESYLKSLQQAKKAGLEEGMAEGLRDGMKQFLAKIDEALIGDLQKEFADIADDTQLSQENRNDIVELGKTYAAMKSCVEEPTKDLDEFEKQCDQLGKKFDQLLKNLAGLKGK